LYLCNQFSTETATVIVIYVDARYESFVTSCRERFLTAAACTIRNSLDIPKLFRQNCEKRLLASSCLSVRPPGSHWTDFHDILYYELLIGFPRQPWLCARASMLHYVHCLSRYQSNLCFPTKRLPAALPIEEIRLFCIAGMT